MTILLACDQIARELWMKLDERFKLDPSIANMV